MMRRRLALIAGSVLLLATAGAPGALAATYPPTADAIEIEGGSTDIAVGDLVPINAQTFRAGSDVTFTVSSPLASLGSSRGGVALVDAAASGTCATGESCVRVADSDGVATAEVSFTQAGTQTVTATGVDPNGEPLTVTSTVTVGAAADADGDDTDGDNDNDNDNDNDSGGLANTGADILKFGVIGLGLLAVGSLLVVTVRRRSPGSPA